MFKSKSQKEIEKRMLIRKTINAMNKQIDALEEQKKVFIDKAKEAKKKGLDSQYNLALSGYKMTLAQQKRAQEMLLNFEITSQMKDMSMMTSQFLGGMSVLSKEMAKLTDSKEFLKVQAEFEKAMAGVETQTEQMDVFMDMSQSSFSSQASADKSITDEQFAAMISEENSQDEMSSDDIDRELEEIRKKINSEV